MNSSIFWFTGNTGAGKTTVVTGVQQWLRTQKDSSLHHRVIVLDGDVMRATISTDVDLSPEGRAKHNRRVARLAHALSEQGFVVLVSVIAPFADVRQEIDALCHPYWIYVAKDGLASDDRPYEPPEHPDLLLDHNTLSADDSLKAALEFIEEHTALS